MSITITSQTKLPDPRNWSYSRRTIGIGEEVTFSANRAVRWTVRGSARQGQQSSITDQFLAAGIHTVIAEAAGENASLDVSVVAPSLRYHKIDELSVPGDLNAIGFNISSSALGAAMRLRIVLTPLGVSFAGLQFRERVVSADRIWGYLDTHRDDPALSPLLTHRTHEQWSNVNLQNEVTDPDITAFFLNGSAVPWPFAAGGLRYLIPVEYRIGSQVFSFSAPTPQAVRFDPSQREMPMRGTFTVWKGGVSVRKTYTAS